MQFPVPQFTDVEDKIIGPLTTKQFGIIFAVGVVVFLGYALTKSLVVTVFLFVVLGLPALGLALVPYNGRPLYTFIGKLISFIFSVKLMIFHKEVHSLESSVRLKDADIIKKEDGNLQQAPKTNLKDLEALLKETAEREREIARQMKQ